MTDVSAVLGIAGSGGFIGWIGLSGLALMTSTVILAFMYIWSIFFKNPQMTGMVKVEVYEVLVTVFILAIVALIVGSLQTLTVGTFFPSGLLPPDLPPDTNIYDAAEKYFLKVKEEMLGWIELGYVFNIFADQLASTTPYTRPFSVGFVSTPFAGIGAPIKQMLSHSIIGLVIAYVINYAQYFVLLFSINVFLKYYLPVGIFMRCFTPTRKIGGSIIATTIAFLIVFPVLATLGYLIFYSEDGPMLSFSRFVGLQGSGSLMGGFLSDLSGDLKDWIYSDEDTNLISLFGNMVFFPLYAIVRVVETLFGTLFFLVLGFAAGVIGRAFLIGYILPTFNILMLIQATKGLSRSIGEEIDISSLTRLI